MSHEKKFTRSECVAMMQNPNLTVEEAVALSESNWWEDFSMHEVARLQANQERLCMPFSLFHKAVESVVGRSVYTHEFANQKRIIAMLG